MKKLLFSLFAIGALCLGFIACDDEEEQLAPGSIYGVVTDKATGEPIRSAGVELSPTGAKTVTGSEGQFEFTELKPDKYTLLITKTGYVDFSSNAIVVKPGLSTKSDVQIEQLPPALKVVNDNRQEIDTLNFGDAEADIARSFNIFNDGEESLTFEITNTAIWIDSISKIEGTVAAGNVAPVVVRINRDLLAEGENKTTLNITSNSGSKQITILATNNRVAISLNVLDATNISSAAATFNGQILNVGNPHYTKRGFVYSLEPMPTKENTLALLTATLTEDSLFSVVANNLELKKTYYVRAYAENQLGVVYSSNQISFSTHATLPTISTQTVSSINIAAGTATFNGTILTLGDPIYSERGFAYGITPNPTVDDTKKVVSGTGIGGFAANIMGLAEGKTYYVRAYATNAEGTVYGESVSFSMNASMPTISTQAVTNIRIGAGTATFNGKVLSLGDLGYTERGFVYAATHNPTIDDTKLIASGAGTGVYSLNATEILEGATYYVRAYVTNNKGTVYGEEVEFDFTAIMPTIATGAVTNINIAQGTATLNGKILTAGDPAFTEHGFVYGLSRNPALLDGSKNVTVPGTAVGDYFINVSSLEEGKTYYVRAYATSSKGTVYGEEVSFNTIAGMPTISTQAVTNINIGAGTATFNGTIETLGDLGYTEKGFVYGLSKTPSLSDASKVIVQGTEQGAYFVTVSALAEGKTYYVRAYITNAKGTVYGEEVSFVTEATMPTISTQPVTHIKIGAGTATFNGKILTLGDLGYTERGFVYGRIHNPTIDDTKLVASGSGIGVYSVNVTEIAEGATYYVRAYVTNSKGTVYGEEVQFDFKAIMPTLVTKEVTNINIASGTVTLNGTILTIGDPALTEHGFVYGLARNPTLLDATKVIVPGREAGDYFINISALSEGQTYYVRAYATNSKGTVYGDEVSFGTTATMPTVATADVTNIRIGAGLATFNGSVLTLGDLGYTERGFVYAATHNPTIDDKKVVASGSGIGTYSVNATEIAEGSIYYVRAYVTNAKGTVYGDEVSLDFKAIMPTLTTKDVTNLNIAAGTVTFNGTILTTGDPALIERGFVYGLSRNPALLDGSTSVIVPGTSAGDYMMNVSSLVEGSTYYVRAYATSSKGTVYGEEISFNTTATMPTVSTQAVTNVRIGAGTATFNGTIEKLGDLGYTERGFVYAETHNPTIDDTKLVVSGGGTGTYSVNATEMAEGSIYYVRAYVTNSKGTVYGNEVEFDFTAIMPIVSTQAITGKMIGLGVATLNGRIETIGDPAYTERGFVYGIAPNPTKDDATIKLVSGTGIGDFTANLSELEMGTIYYVRAFATNIKGTVYGNDVELDFQAIMPVVTTTSVEITSITTALASGSIETIGDPAYIERGFVYGTMPVPTLDNGASKAIAVGNEKGNFQASLINLTSSVNYYVRAYAISTAGIAYGDVKSISEDDWTYYNIPTIEYGGYTYKYYEIGTMNRSEAWSNCQNVNLGGYNDWYCPSVSEMAYILFNTPVGDNKQKLWWSADLFSSYHSSYYFIYYDTSKESWCSNYAHKDNIMFVCAVRKYKE